METKKEIKNHVIKIGILVVAIITLGISLTYAYYTAKFSGTANLDEVKAGEIYVTSSLTDATAISNMRMSLIEASEVNTKADKVEFTITNASNSTVNGQYYVQLTDVQISKNLYNQYFKWQLVRKTETEESVVESGNFASTVRNGSPVEGEANNVVTAANDIALNNSAIELPIGTTDNLIFRIWLENDPDVNQLELTNGSFQAKLKIEAIPKK